MPDCANSITRAIEPRSRTIAVVAWQALPAVLPRSGKNVGGTETGAWRLVRNLAAQPGLAPVLVVRSPGPAPSEVDGVRIHAQRDPREYVRRDFSSCVEWGRPPRLKRWSAKLLWQIPYLAATWPWRKRDPEPLQPDPRLEEIAADLWIALGANKESAGVVATAQRQGRPCLLLIQANSDLDPRNIADPDSRNPYGELGLHCRFAIENATAIACQTRHQRSLLEEQFRRQGILTSQRDRSSALEAGERQTGGLRLMVRKV